MDPKLIVALDFDNQSKALSLVDKLDNNYCALKVGSEMFTLFGASFLNELMQRRFKVFLDLKFHDIPNTVVHACKAAADLGVWMMNVHALGGLKMMHAAKQAMESYGKDAPMLIAVTVLTSFAEEDLKSVGINHSIMEQVKSLAALAKEAGLDGIVSSAHEVAAIKQQCGAEFITVTPGVRLLDGKKDDQFRIMTPREAIKEGADYLVIGRPITQSSEPTLMVSKILQDLALP